MPNFSKSYRKFPDALQMLREEVQICTVRRISALPSERRLSEKLNISRNTIRKALQVLLAENVIIREGYKNLIPQIYQNLEKAGRICFCACGEGHSILYPAVERLWEVLQPLLLRQKADISLYLIEDGCKHDSLLRELSTFDVIISAAIPRDMVASFSALRGKILIEVVAPNPSVPNYLLLDNQAVGRMAAEWLVRHDCKKMFALWESCHGNCIIPGRAWGFANELQRRDLGGIESVFWIRRTNGGVIDAARRVISWCLEEKYDGLFLLSDENIGELLGEFIKSGLIPKKMRVIAADGTASARKNQPSLSTVSHATEKVAIELSNQLRLIANRQFRGIQKLIQPIIYPGTIDNF